VLGLTYFLWQSIFMSVTALVEDLVFRDYQTWVLLNPLGLGLKSCNVFKIKAGQSVTKDFPEYWREKEEMNVIPPKAMSCKLWHQEV